MNARVFYPRIGLRLALIGTVVVITLIGTAVVITFAYALLVDHGKYVRWLGLASIMALEALIIVLAFVDIKYRKRPLFVISETEIQICNPHRIVQIDQIEQIKALGTTNLELVLKGALPVPLVLVSKMGSGNGNSVLTERNRRDVHKIIS